MSIDSGDFITVVGSSNIESFGYDSEERSLYVRFNGSKGGPSSLYKYIGVEPEVFDQFMDAPSKGKFVFGYLKNRYEYQRVE